MTAELVEYERQKYRKAWATERYQTHSPGARMAGEIAMHVRGLGALSLTDYGCGNGRALQIFGEQYGLKLYGVDLVATAAGARKNCPYAIIWDACLWDLPKALPETDFAFSCDVLEHLPPEFVRPTLEAIAAKTRLGGFFQVYTAPDTAGEEIGETLHLTVESAHWWREEIERFFDISIMRINNDVRPQFWVRAR